jgi:hypothetical protein
MEVTDYLHAPAALTRGKGPPVPIVLEAGWVPELVWALWRHRNSLPLPGIEPQLGHPVRSLVIIIIIIIDPHVV